MVTLNEFESILSEILKISKKEFRKKSEVAGSSYPRLFFYFVKEFKHYLPLWERENATIGAHFNKSKYYVSSSIFKIKNEILVCKSSRKKIAEIEKLLKVFLTTKTK